MKFSSEYANEQQAQARQTALQGLGYSAWRTHKPDDTWQVYWMVRL
jgi:hypothetical protein